MIIHTKSPLAVWRVEILNFRFRKLLSVFGLDQTVVSVLSLIYDAGLFRDRVVEHEEAMSDKIHLHDRFLGGHRGIFKLLCSYDDVLVVLLDSLYRCCGNSFVGNQTLTQLFAKSGLVLSDLPLYIIN